MVVIRAIITLAYCSGNRRSFVAFITEDISKYHLHYTCGSSCITDERKRNIFNCCTTLECTSTNLSYGVGNYNLCYQCCILECIVTNRRNAIPCSIILEDRRDNQIFSGLTGITNQSSIFTRYRESYRHNCFCILISTITCIGCIAIFGSCRFSYNRGVAVTKSGDSLLCLKNGVTHRAVLTFGQTGSRTGRCYSSIDYFGVAESTQNLLGLNNSATYRAVLTFGQTGFRAGRRYSHVNCFSMCYLFNSNFAANITENILAARRIGIAIAFSNRHNFNLFRNDLSRRCYNLHPCTVTARRLTAIL